MYRICRILPCSLTSGERQPWIVSLIPEPQPRWNASILLKRLSPVLMRKLQCLWSMEELRKKITDVELGKQFRFCISYAFLMILGRVVYPCKIQFPDLRSGNNKTASPSHLTEFCQWVANEGRFVNQLGRGVLILTLISIVLILEWVFLGRLEENSFREEDGMYSRND